MYVFICEGEHAYSSNCVCHVHVEVQEELWVSFFRCFLETECLLLMDLLMRLGWLGSEPHGPAFLTFLH